MLEPLGPTVSKKSWVLWEQKQLPLDQEDCLMACLSMSAMPMTLEETRLTKHAV